MRARGIIAAGMLAMAAMARASFAQSAAPADGMPPPPVPAATGAQQIETLQQRLLASQQIIATLERQLADARNRAVAMDQCRVKNGRLVLIGRELIEGYERRYRQTTKDPLQLGRRRFEFELQSLSDAVYDNRAEVTTPLPGAAQPAATGAAAPPTPTAPAAGKDK